MYKIKVNYRNGSSRTFNGYYTILSGALIINMEDMEMGIPLTNIESFEMRSTEEKSTIWNDCDECVMDEVKDKMV